jgi:hypothetical protein
MAKSDIGWSATPIESTTIEIDATMKSERADTPGTRPLIVAVER